MQREMQASPLPQTQKSAQDKGMKSVTPNARKNRALGVTDSAQFAVQIVPPKSDMNPITYQTPFLRSYPTAEQIISQEDGIPDGLRRCAQHMTDKGAGQARFCVLNREGDCALFELAGYYISVLSDGTILDGDDALAEAVTAHRLGALAGDQDGEN